MTKQRQERNDLINQEFSQLIAERMKSGKYRLMDLYKEVGEKYSPDHAGILPIDQRYPGAGFPYEIISPSVIAGRDVLTV
jgi:hypothetical protein